VSSSFVFGNWLIVIAHLFISKLVFRYIQSSLAFCHLLCNVFSWLFLLNLGCLGITSCRFPLLIHCLCFPHSANMSKEETAALRKRHSIETDKGACKEWEKRPWRVIIIVLAERGRELGACVLYSSSKFIKEAFSATHCSSCSMVSLKRRKLPSDKRSSETTDHL